jgi:hypothetical protein
MMLRPRELLLTICVALVLAALFVWLLEPAVGWAMGYDSALGEADIEGAAVQEFRRSAVMAVCSGLFFGGVGVWLLPPVWSTLRSGSGRAAGVAGLVTSVGFLVMAGASFRGLIRIFTDFQSM